MPASPNSQYQTWYGAIAYSARMHPQCFDRNTIPAGSRRTSHPESTTTIARSAKNVRMGSAYVAFASATIFSTSR